MSNTLPVPAVQDADQVLAEHAGEIRRLSKRLIDDLIEIGRRLTDAMRRTWSLVVLASS